MNPWSAAFADFTAFERLVLNLVAPLASLQSPQGPGGRRDLRTRTAGVVLEMAHLGPRDEAKERGLEAALKPLAFGAAWKVVDLLVEFSQYGQASGKHVPLKEKLQAARAGGCPPLPVEIWKRVVELYANTSEARHCLVHRRFQVGVLGELTGFVVKAGQTVRDITAPEQDAFCRLAQRLADAAITGAMRPRARGDMAWLLNQLADHHRELAIAGDQALEVRLLVDDAKRDASGWTLDVAALLQQEQANHRQGTLFDLELHFPGTSHPPLYCALDEAPRQKHSIDPSAWPSWLSPYRG